MLGSSFRVCLGGLLSGVLVRNETLSILLRVHVPFGCIEEANDTVNAARWNHESYDHQNTVIMHDRPNQMRREFLSNSTFDNSSHNEVLTMTKGNVTQDRPRTSCGTPNCRHHALER